MPETRTDRTAFLSLLALMQAAADLDDYSFPYWNAQQIDACFAGLHQAARTGVVPLSNPAAPSLFLLGSGGMLAGGQTFEVGQTFVDAFGRETAASTVASLSTGDAIPDPLVAPTLSDPSTHDSGFEGGTLEAWYSWVDASGGETSAGPEAILDLPYLSGGLFNRCTFSLPDAASSVGAAGANVYIRFRGGNVVLAKRIQSSSATDCTLDATVVDCYRSLPLSNMTNGAKAITITGAPVAEGESALYTRFYIRPQGEGWPGDRRLRLAGIDQWDPATVTYPLVYSGLSTDLAPGFPPATSQVKAIRPIDLTTEVTGVLPAANMEGGAGGGGGGGSVSDAALARELATMLMMNELVLDDLALWTAQNNCLLVSFSSGLYSRDGVVAGMMPGTDSSLNLPVSAGTAVVSGVVSTYAGGTIAIPNNQTRKVWWDGAALHQAASWPSTPHAKVATVVTLGGVIDGADSEAGDPTGLSPDTSRLECPPSTQIQWYSTIRSVPAGIKRLLTNWRVSQQPDTGATIMVEANLDESGGPHFVAGESQSDFYEPAPQTVSFHIAIDNEDATTPVWIDSFGAIWEEVT
jgi:hypothetical protein